MWKSSLLATEKCLNSWNWTFQTEVMSIISVKLRESNEYLVTWTFECMCVCVCEQLTVNKAQGLSDSLPRFEDLFPSSELSM